ncbi:MAG: glycosyltransferase N-terminal domain-containing protein, partial [Methylotenera sp.]|nr:glycosyltransferase N-terminal domain-containing protein [Methylotenera sp.]
KLGAVVQQGLQSLSAVGAQTSQDAERLKNLGAHNVSIMGNLKFDVTPQDNAVTQGQLLRDRLGENRPIFLAASTRDGEEVLIIDAVTKANIPNLLTIIVPRHPQRFEEVATLLKKNRLGFVRRSTLSNEAIPQNISYLLGDSMGEMFTYYAACDVAFIGGSLLPLGGQNLIEAFSLGKPVLIGPHTFNFAQVTELAIAAGAAQRVQNTTELAHSIKVLFVDQTKRQAMSDAALSFSAQSRGATQRTLSLIEQYL